MKLVQKAVWSAGVVCVVMTLSLPPQAATKARVKTAVSDKSHSSAPLSANIGSQFMSPFNNPRYDSAIMAVEFLDPKSGTVLFEQNARKSVMPASCLKTITSAAAMHFLGSDHTFTTTLEAGGTTDPTGVLHGPLIIRGGGDPTLGSSRVDGSVSSPTLLQEWADAIKAAGIHEAAGGIVGDDSYFPWEPIPDDWTWSDIGNYYGAGTSGLCFNDNLYLLYFKPGRSIGQPAAIVRTEPPMSVIQWINDMKTGPAGSGDQGDIYGSPASNKRWVRGTIPAGGEFAIKGAMPDPAAGAAFLLSEKLKAAGVQVKGPIRGAEGRSPLNTSRTLLSRHESPPLRSIVRTLNKQSFNLYAEMFLMNIAKTTSGSRESGIAAEREYLQKLGVPLEGMTIMDGSGLSRRDTVTADGMARLMGALQREPYFDAWKDSLPVLGVDGDLRNRETTSPLKGKVKAKTGLISKVRGLCGYLETRSGRTICFALLANQYSGNWQDVDKDFDLVLRDAYEKY